MIKHYLLFTAIGVVSGAHSAVLANTDPFLESDGLLIIETESGELQGNWSIENAIYGHTGQSYLVWEGTNFLGAPNGESTISYPVRISTPGNYQLQWRSRNTVGLDATEHNDSWVRFPTGENIEGQHSLEKGEDGNRWTKAYMGHVEQWTWDTFTVDGNNQPIRQYLEAGDHLIEIAGRSTGHSIDRVGLYLYEERGFNTALFETLNQSPRASESFETHHVYTGNVCAVQELTLSADIALQVTNTARIQPDDIITVNGSSTIALLQFSLPDNIQSDSVSLSLSGLGSLSGLSVYLGSHNDWNTQTALNDLPHSSVLLGELSGASAQNDIQSINIDRSMISGNTVTLVLESTSNSNHQVFGIGTGAEPRLNFTLSADACEIYQSARINTPFLSDNQSEVETGTQTENETATETETVPASESDSESELQPITVQESGTDTETDADTSTEPNTETNTGTNTDTDTDTDLTEISEEERTEESNTTTARSSGGGAFSALFIGALALFGIYRRAGHNLSTEQRNTQRLN